MYVCVCRAVTENEVHDCIAAGAKSAKQVRDTTGAGGRLRPVCTKDLCDAEKGRRNSRPHSTRGLFHAG
ncbi:bacterioferritin-associated ferredoxin [Nonomuraea ferruginea]